MGNLQRHLTAMPFERALPAVALSICITVACLLDGTFAGAEGGVPSAEPSNRVVILLGGSKGYVSRSYSSCVKALSKRGIDGVLLDYLSPTEISELDKEPSATRRLREAAALPHWVASVEAEVKHLRTSNVPGRAIGLMGVSLGGRVMFDALAADPEIGAIAAVDGGPDDRLIPQIKALPPMLVVWGKEDRVFNPRIAQALSDRAKELGTPVTSILVPRGQHDFFVADLQRSETICAEAASFFDNALSGR
jgi:carboxymethylenebutenolidase